MKAAQSIQGTRNLNEETFFCTEHKLAWWAPTCKSHIVQTLASPWVQAPEQKKKMDF